MLRATDSLPQPTTRPHVAPDCTPASLSRVLTGTPSQLLLLVSPCSACAVALSAPLPQPLLPPHSRNSMRLIDGKRCRSARREDRRPIDHAVDGQRVFLRIDRRRRVVVDDVVQVGRCDDAAQRVDRGARADEFCVPVAVRARLFEWRPTAEGGCARADHFGRIGRRASAAVCWACWAATTATLESATAPTIGPIPTISARRDIPRAMSANTHPLSLRERTDGPRTGVN